jgi:hypothetical protein
VVHHARIGLVVMNTEILQLQIFVPWKHHQAPVKYRMNVVPESRIVAVLMGVETTAHFHVLFHHHDFLAALGEIAGTDHAVVTGADDNAVVF